MENEDEIAEEPAEKLEDFAAWLLNKPAKSNVQVEDKTPGEADETAKDDDNDWNEESTPV